MATGYKPLDKDELVIVVNTQEIGRLEEAEKENSWNQKTAKGFLNRLDFPETEEHNTIWLKDLRRMDVSAITRLIVVIPPGLFPSAAYSRFLRDYFSRKVFMRLTEIWVSDKGEKYSHEKHHESYYTYEKFSFTQVLRAFDIRIHNFPNSPGTITFKEVPIYVSSKTSNISMDFSNGTDLYLTMNEDTTEFQTLHLAGTNFQRIHLLGNKALGFINSMKRKGMFYLAIHKVYFESNRFSFVNLPNGNLIEHSYIEFFNNTKIQPIVHIRSNPPLSTNFLKFSCY